MDELVAVGTAGLLGLAAVAVLLAGAIWWILATLWAALLGGDWGSIARTVLTLLLILFIYAGAGFWFQKTGRI